MVHRMHTSINFRKLSLLFILSILFQLTNQPFSHWQHWTLQKILCSLSFCHISKISHPTCMCLLPYLVELVYVQNWARKGLVKTLIQTHKTFFHSGVYCTIFAKWNSSTLLLRPAYTFYITCICTSSLCCSQKWQDHFVWLKVICETERNTWACCTSSSVLRAKIPRLRI